MKKWLMSCALFSCALQADFNFKADDITYEFLTQEGPNRIDYIPHFKTLFGAMKIKTILEFGQNVGTKYFLDMCNKVIGVDFISHGYGPGTLQSYMSLYAECPNWIPIVYFTGYQGSFPYWAPYKYLASEHVYKACSYQDVTCKSYAHIDNFYRVELDAFIKNLAKCHKIDLAFVHPVLYLRSDLVELLFSKVGIIVAYDTHCRYFGQMDDKFGYYRLQVPEDYEEIYLKGGTGTTVWISKQEKYQKLSETLKHYAQAL